MAYNPTIKNLIEKAYTAGCSSLANSLFKSYILFNFSDLPWNDIMTVMMKHCNDKNILNESLEIMREIRSKYTEEGFSIKNLPSLKSLEELSYNTEFGPNNEYFEWFVAYGLEMLIKFGKNVPIEDLLVYVDNNDDELASLALDIIESYTEKNALSLGDIESARDNAINDFGFAATNILIRGVVEKIKKNEFDDQSLNKIWLMLYEDITNENQIVWLRCVGTIGIFSENEISIPPKIVTKLSELALDVNY